jgi:hypothetical protein
MTKEKLLRLKAGLLALIMCISLSACGNSEENNQENKNTDRQEEQVDNIIYLIVFVEGKAYIYEDTESASTTIREGGYAKIYDDGDYLYFLQTPTIILRGKENAVNFASSTVGEENIIFISWSETQEGQLILKPNN